MRTRMIIGLALLVAAAAVASADEVYVAVTQQDPGLPVYIEARQLLMEGKFAEAAEKFEAFLSAYADSRRVDDALFYLGYCRERLGQRSEAFRQYLSAIDRFGDTIASRRSFLRALELAQQLRQKEGDVYDKFLAGNVESETFRSYRLFSAIRLAELGDWRGMDVILEGMEKSNDALKVRIASLLGRKISDRRVIEAFEKALSKSENEIVRMTAAANLARVSTIKPVRESLAKAMREDTNEFVRLTAARTLRIHIDEEEVEQAYSYAIRHETSPMVISIVMDAVAPQIEGEELEKVIVERIEIETDPMTKYALMNGLRVRPDVKPPAKFYVSFLEKQAPPLMKIKALNMLAPSVREPEVRTIVLETLENDPDGSVKVAAASHLVAYVEEADVRDAMLTVTLENSNNFYLVSTTVRALAPQAEKPEVRGKLVELLHVAESPEIASTVVDGLAILSTDAVVQNAFLDLVESSDNADLKAFTLRRFGRVSSPEILDRIEGLFRRERNEALAQLYLSLISEADPERARRLNQ